MADLVATTAAIQTKEDLATMAVTLIKEDQIIMVVTVIRTDLTAEAEVVVT